VSYDLSYVLQALSGDNEDMNWLETEGVVPADQRPVLCWGINYDTRGEPGYFVGSYHKSHVLGPPGKEWIEPARWVYGKQETEAESVTHWMPLPESP
jgi:hypothetical protein